MSRSIPFIRSRILFAAFGIALCAMGAPIQAQTLVTTSKFSLTYPGSDWQKFPIASDSAAMVLNMANEAVSFLLGVPHSGGELTTEQLKAATATYAPTDSLTLTAEGDKTLGGKTFAFVEFKPAVSEAGQENERYRVYFYTQGNFLFEAILVFDTGTSPTAVADLESALATLSLSPSAGLRRLAEHARPHFRSASLDVLGRTHGSLSTGRVAVPTYIRR